MTSLAKDAVRKTAMRIYKDPTSALTADAKKLAVAVLLLLDGKLPR